VHSAPTANVGVATRRRDVLRPADRCLIFDRDWMLLWGRLRGPPPRRL